jgi:DNA-binding CsgD family transcriptional regulator
MTLLERDEALAQLQVLMARACGGTGALVVVEGEAGIGKSALLRALADAQPAATPVWWGLCDALQTPRPLGPWLDVAEQAGDPLRALLVTDAPRPRVFAACVDQLGAQSALVIIEDLHWADEATLDLLRHLGRRIARTRSLLVASCRDDELGPTHPVRVLLGDLATAGVQRLALRPLSIDAVRQLVADRPLDALALHQATGGNPFFVTEVLAAGGSRIPASVRDAVLSRSARLSASARAVLEMAAVAGPRVEAGLLDELAAAEAAAVDDCLRSGILTAEAQTFVFRHELARQAVLESLAPTRLRVLHRLTLQALQADGAPPPSLARLVHHAAQAGDSEAVRLHAPAAAQQAARQGAHREAAAHYATLLAFSSALDAAQRAQFTEAHAYECYLVGDIASAVAGREAALGLWRRLGRRDREGDTLRWLSRLHWFLGHGELARRHAQAAIDTLEPLPASSELAMACSNAAQLAMLADNAAAAVSWGERAIALAEALGATEILAHALNNVGTARIRDSDEAGWRLLERSLQIALAHDLEEHAGRAYANLTSCGVELRDYAAAWRYCNDGIAYCLERDLDAWTFYLMAWRARAHYEQGRWSAAAAEAAGLVQRAGLPNVSRIPALVTLGAVRVRRGDPGAHELLDEARTLALDTGELQRIGPMVVARAEAAWLAGDLEACTTEAQMGADLAERCRMPWAIGEGTFWLWRAGRSVTPGDGMARPYVLQMRGDWRAAAEAWCALGCPYEQARALTDGDEGALREALAIFESLGAAPMIERVRRSLRVAGVRGLPRGPRATTQEHPAGLTLKEVQVLALLAQGLRSREIGERLSRSTRTVDHHLASIFVKLGVATRAEAVSAAHRLGLVQATG